MLTMAALLLTALLFLFSLLSLLLFSRTRPSKHKLPPGPYNLPLVGNLHRLGALPHRPLRELSREHGPLMYLKLGSVPVVVASSADTAREFLKTHDHECCNRPGLTSFRKLTYGYTDMALSPYGEGWRERRKFSMLHLLGAKKVASFRPVREEEVQRMIGSISSSSLRGNSINLTEEVAVLIYSTICRTAFGKGYDIGGGQLLRFMREWQLMLNGFFFADYIPMLGWVDVLTGMRARLEKNFRDFDGMYQRVIDDCLERRRMGGDACRIDHMEDNFLDALLDMRETTRDNRNQDDIKGLLMNIIFAGTDASLAALDWALAELMRSPGAMRKAQDEVRGLMKSKDKANVDESDVEQLHYLKLVVKESLRLHPVGPLLAPRETMQHFKVQGFDIPARTRLFVNAWAVGRDPGVWERPEEFVPERFEGSAIDFRGNDFELIPFGAGRRICAGMHFGVANVELALANLLYHFDWGLPGAMKREDVDMEEAPGVGVRRRFDLHVVPTWYLKE